MTKAEAAKALGVSEKTVTRYTTSGKLPFQYIRGKTGQQVDITPEAVEALRIELTTPVVPGVIPGTGAETTQARQVEPRQTGQPKSLATVPTPESIPAWAIELTRAAYEAGTAQAGTGKPSQDNPTELAAKMTLNLDEAAVLSGLSRHSLRAAIGEGALVARQIGRGWKVRPADLQAWTDSLFNGVGEESVQGENAPGVTTRNKMNRGKVSQPKDSRAKS